MPRIMNRRMAMSSGSLFRQLGDFSNLPPKDKTASKRVRAASVSSSSSSSCSSSSLEWSSSSSESKDGNSTANLKGKGKGTKRSEDAKSDDEKITKQKKKKNVNSYAKADTDPKEKSKSKSKTESTKNNRTQKPKSKARKPIDLIRWNMRNYNLFHSRLPILEAEPAQIQAWFLTWYWPDKDIDLYVCTHDRNGNVVPRKQKTLKRGNKDVKFVMEEQKEERRKGRADAQEEGADVVDKGEVEVVSVMEIVRLTGVDVRILTVHQLRGYLERCGFGEKDAEWLAIDVGIAKDKEIEGRKPVVPAEDEAKKK